MNNNRILPHLEDLSVFQLRGIGRQVGVVLPTTLKKQDLIDKIRAIVSGQEEPHIKTSNRGRPPKDTSAVDFMQMHEGVEGFFGTLAGYYHSVLPDIASYEGIQPKSPNEEDAIIKVGYVEVTPQNYGYFLTVPQLSLEPIYVKMSLVARFNLRSGDKVEAKIAMDQSSGLLAVYDIIKINDLPVDSRIKYCNFEQLPAIEKEKLVFYKNNQDSSSYAQKLLPFYRGDRAIFSIEEKKSLPYIMYDFLSKVNESDSITNIVFVANDLNPEFIDAVSKLEKVSLVASSFGDAQEYSKKIFELAFTNAKRLSTMQGRNVVLVVQNLSESLNLFTGEDKAKAKDFCKKFFISAKQTEFSSLTCVYSFVGDKELENEYETNESIFVKFLPHNYLTKFKIKYNMLESFRMLSFGQEEKDYEFQQKVHKFVEKGNYYDKHSQIEFALKQNRDIEDFLL